MAELLIRLGADPTLVNSEGETIYERAMEDEHEDLVRYLESLGLNQVSNMTNMFADATGTDGEQDAEDLGDA